MILLDTNVLSELMRPAPAAQVVAWLDAQPAAGVYLCAVTRAEIEVGIARLPEGARRQQIAAAAHLMWGLFGGRCLPFDEAAAVHYGALVAGRFKQGRPITVEDGQIAAIALTHGLTLATRNAADFAGIPDLAVLDPWSVPG